MRNQNNSVCIFLPLFVFGFIHYSAFLESNYVYLREYSYQLQLRIVPQNQTVHEPCVAEKLLQGSIGGFIAGGGGGGAQVCAPLLALVNRGARGDVQKN